MARKVPIRVLSLSAGAFWLFSVPNPRSVDDVADGDADTAELAAQALDAAEVRRFVAELPPRERVVLHLRYGFAGRPMSLREVADFCGSSPATVSAAEQQGLELLRARYRQTSPWAPPHA